VGAGVGDQAGGVRGVQAKVAVAIGNWLASVGEPPEEVVAVLREALGDEEPLVREHAAWGLEGSD
jgi:hypothetical protein